MKRIIIASLLLFLAGLVFAQTENDFDVLQLPDGTLQITKYKGPGGNITIPARLFGIAVSEIGAGYNPSIFNSISKEKITSVTVERGIKKINAQAFAGNGLEHINLPDTLVEIGDMAFCNSNLQELNIPRSVTTIGNDAFFEAFGSNFPSVLYIPSNVKYIGDSAFYKNWYKSNGNRLKELVIESVFTILPGENSPDGYKNPFYGVPMEYLEKITFPANWPDPQLDWLKLPTGFVNYYKSQGRKAGTYVKNGQIWAYSGPATRTQTSSSSGGSTPLPPANAPSQSSSGQVALPPANTANQSSSDNAPVPPGNTPQQIQEQANQHNTQGNTYYNSGNYDQAIAEFTEAIRLNPNDSSSTSIYYGNRAIAYSNKVDYDRAIADCTEAIRLNPNYANAYSTRAYAYMQKGNFTQARADVNKALQIFPNYQYAKTLSDQLQSKENSNTAAAQTTLPVTVPPNNAALPSSASTTGATGGTDDFLPVVLGAVFGIIFWAAVIIFIVKIVKNRKKTGLL